MINTIVITGCSKRIGLGITDFYLKNTSYHIIAVVRQISESLNNLKNNYPERLEFIIKDFDKDWINLNFFETFLNDKKLLKGFIHCASNLIFDEHHNVTSLNFKSQKKIHYEIFNHAIDSYLDFARDKKLNNIPCFINFGDFKTSHNQTIGISYTHSKLLAINSIKEQAIKGLGYLRANIISPGYTLPTEGYNEDFNKIIDSFPFKYTSSISDICDTVNFLIEQRSITGQHIVVDAGAGFVECY